MVVWYSITNFPDIIPTRAVTQIKPWMVVISVRLSSPAPFQNLDFQNTEFNAIINTQSEHLPATSTDMIL